MSSTATPFEFENGQGMLSPDWESPELLAWLAGLPDLPGAETVISGRNRLYKVPFPADDEDAVWLAVKSFKRQSALGDRIIQRRGSKARRAWEVAEQLHAAGVGTPEPVGYLEHWEGARLVESFLITRYEEDTATFRDALLRLYHHEPYCDRFMALLECVAAGIRELHEAGIVHRDLGNQNIFVRRNEAGGWEDVRFIDLNRARRSNGPAPLAGRAFDFSRIALPSDLLRVMVEMYFAPEPVPQEFKEHEARYRARFSLHSRTRKWRHPLRQRRRPVLPPERSYPRPRDLFIWDDRSEQAISPLRRKDRRHHDTRGNHLRIAGSVLRTLPGLRQTYRELLEGAYTQPVIMTGRAGIALSSEPERFARERPWLEKLGPNTPVFLRFYHHAPTGTWRDTAGRVRELHAAGHPVGIALVQDRRAVRAPAAWGGWAEKILSEVGPLVDTVEIGHAINRVKWGVWDLAEYQRLLAPFVELQRARPELTLTGPAVIDFEYQYLAAALDAMPKGLQFGALSHHLYVDRRGAPENPQGRFDTLRKLALARAIARHARACDDRLIISEVNWPLKDSGVYSPVVSPYDSPGTRHNDPSVDEQTYADYLLRYLLISLCSGLAEKVYWWKLAARGFGLIDDRDPEAYRPRPAFDAFRDFLAHTRGCTFSEHQQGADGKAQAFGFVSKGQSSPDRWIAYAHSNEPLSSARALPGIPGLPRQLDGTPVFVG